MSNKTKTNMGMTFKACPLPIPSLDHAYPVEETQGIFLRSNKVLCKINIHKILIVTLRACSVKLTKKTNPKVYLIIVKVTAFLSHIENDHFIIHFTLIDSFCLPFYHRTLLF